MPSIRITPPRPNQVRRNAPSFCFNSSALLSFSFDMNTGFSTGDRRVMDALSFLFWFFLLATAAALDGMDPKPWAEEAGFFGEAAMVEESSVLAEEFGV